MALFNEILAGRFNKQLLKLFNMKGQAPAPQVGGDIIADVTLEQDRPEWGWLKGELRFGAHLFVTNGGAFNSRVRLRLTTPNVLCVVTSIRASSPSVGQTFSVFVGGASYNADLVDVPGGTVLPADSRVALVPGGNWGQGAFFPLLCTGQNSDTATAGTVFAHGAAPINQTVELLGGPLMMASPNSLIPNSTLLKFPIGLDVRCGAANAQLEVSMYGYVRALEEGEQIAA